MIFNELDKSVTTRLCTLATLVGDVAEHEQGLLFTGQQLGLSKEDVREVLNEWDEEDVMSFNSESEKIQFVTECFDFIQDYRSSAPEIKLYREVLSALNLYQSSLN